jgi:hypothetical protein
MGLKSFKEFVEEYDYNEALLIFLEYGYFSVEDVFKDEYLLANIDDLISSRKKVREEIEQRKNNIDHLVNGDY